MHHKRFRLAAQRPANAQDVEAWKQRGAYDEAIRIPADGWDFRTTNGFIEGMTVFSRGEFRPDVGHLYFPRPIPKPAHAMRTSWAARWCLCADCVRAGL